MMKRKLIIAVLAVLVIATPLAAYWHYQDRQCKQRQMVVDDREAQLYADAKNIPVAAPKQAVEEFFKANGIIRSLSSGRDKTPHEAASR